MNIYKSKQNIVWQTILKNVKKFFKANKKEERTRIIKYYRAIKNIKNLGVTYSS